MGAVHRAAAHAAFEVAAILVAVAILPGCLWLADVGVQLAVTPTVLDFGSDGQAMSVTITKNTTRQPMAPLKVTAQQPWIVPETCLDVDEGCVSAGPLDAVVVPLHVQRSLMTLGANIGTLTLEKFEFTNIRGSMHISKGVVWRRRSK